MTISIARRQELNDTHRRHEKDSGSPEVQVAVLTERIKNLTEHLREHKHDYSTQRGLLGMVSKRTRLLRYLSRTNHAGYQALIKDLGLRR